MSESSQSNGPAKGSLAKAIGNLAKKQSDVTRGGAAKMKFTPTLPARRTTVTRQTDSSSMIVTPQHANDAPAASRARGRGRGVSGRGIAAPLTATGPFALGPSVISSSRQSALRSATSGSAPASTSRTESSSVIPSTKSESSGKDATKKEKSEVAEVYSDPEDGVEIIDIQQVTATDWMAPNILDKTDIPGPHKDRKAAKSSSQNDVESKDIKSTQIDAALLTNDDSEQEQFESLRDFFLRQDSIDPQEALRNGHEELFFFQFPSPFPTFDISSHGEADEPASTLPASQPVASDKGKGVDRSERKQVSFAADTKPAAAADTEDNPESLPEGSEQQKQQHPSGCIGQLELYESGAVKIRIGGIDMDVCKASPSSFLQYAAHVSESTNRMTMLGELKQRFVVSPNVSSLLDDIARSTR